jgi:hypothetical protein
VNAVLRVASWAALAGTICPSAWYLAGRMPLERANALLLAATVAWFLLAGWRQQRLARSAEDQMPN